MVESASALEKSVWWEGHGLHKQGCANIIMHAYNSYLRGCGYLCLVILGVQARLNFFINSLISSLI
jgi:hypothetical protein